MIYLIHFDSPYHHARHYIGYCEDGRLAQRLARHRPGRCSPLMLAVEPAGIDWVVALTLPGDRSFERQLKRAHQAGRFSPICRSAG